jgi:hypothetical protein
MNKTRWSLKLLLSTNVAMWLQDSCKNELITMFSFYVKKNIEAIVIHFWGYNECFSGNMTGQRSHR